jgi:quercetin dioxygenase-like cupin family protein
MIGFVESCVVLIALSALSSQILADSIEPDSRLHPGEVRVLNLDDSDLREIIPHVLSMKHWFGTNLSAATFHFEKGQGDSKAAMPAMHQHGEELAIQLKGNSQVIEKDGTVHEIAEGDVFIIKPWIWHTGTFGDRENKILGIVTPPRTDYPAEGLKSYYPGQRAEQAQ